MSEQTVDGLMVVIGPAVFMIPAEDLRAFRTPDDLAEKARDQLEGLGQDGDDPSDGPKTAMVGVRFSPADQTFAFSSIYEHAITVSRRWC